MANTVNSRHLNYVQGYRQEIELWLKSSPGSSLDPHLIAAIGEIAQVEAILLYALKRHEDAKKSYDSIWALGYKGACYVHIGRLQEAKMALEQGLRLIGAGTHRQAVFYKDFVIAHSLEKNVEAACSCARLAMQIAKDTKAPMELQDAQDAVQEFLKPWKDSPIMKNLSEEFREVQQEFVSAQRNPGFCRVGNSNTHELRIEM